MNTDYRDVVRLVNYVSGQLCGGRVAMIEQTHITANSREVMVAVDVPHSTMTASRDNLKPLVSAVRQAMLHFPGITVEDAGSQPYQGMQKQYFKLTERTALPTLKDVI